MNWARHCAQQRRRGTVRQKKKKKLREMRFFFFYVEPSAPSRMFGVSEYHSNGVDDVDGETREGTEPVGKRNGNVHSRSSSQVITSEPTLQAPLLTVWKGHKERVMTSKQERQKWSNKQTHTSCQGPTTTTTTAFELPHEGFVFFNLLRSNYMENQFE